MKYIIIDIDGTICQKHPDRGITKLDKMYLDTPITPVLDVIETLYNHKDVFPIFITARDESSRLATARWLQENTLLPAVTTEVETNLYMFRCLKKLAYSSGVIYGSDIPINKDSFVLVNIIRDAVIKQQLLNQFLKDYNTTKDKILGVFENDKECIEMYRREGLFVFDVNQGEN